MGLSVVWDSDIEHKASKAGICRSGPTIFFFDGLDGQKSTFVRPDRQKTHCG